jgi:hypothetical protein
VMNRCLINRGRKLKVYVQPWVDPAEARTMIRAHLSKWVELPNGGFEHTAEEQTIGVISKRDRSRSVARHPSWARIPRNHFLRSG